MAAKRAGNLDEDENFSYIESDLRYKHIKKTNKETSSAAIIFIMDVSGSMSKDKKYLARSFFFLLYHFIRSRYENTEIVFIAHDTRPYEVDEDKFFNRGTGGGTMVSPTMEYVHDVITKRYNPNNWNVYAFHCSDGDNWPTDNDAAFELTSKVSDLCQLYGYCEIDPSAESTKWLNSFSLLELYGKCSKIKCVEINKKEDVWPAFNKFFGSANK